MMKCSVPMATGCMLVFAMAVLAAPWADAQVWRVDKSAVGAGTGLSWTDAFTTIQPAIDEAYDAGGGEVWVAGGPVGTPLFYNETRHEAWGGVSGSLVMKDNVHVYGGFEGWRGGNGAQEIDRNQRVRAQNIAVIDGSAARAGNAAYHVVVFGRAAEATVNARLDGFHITGGNAAGASGNYHTYRGGGIYVWQSAPVIANCYIYSNSAEVSGGGVANESSATITANAQYINCVIALNTARREVDWQGNPVRGGGGVFINKSAPTLTHVTITSNSTGAGDAVGSGDFDPMPNYGLDSGGIYNYSNDALPSTESVLLSSIIWANTGSDGIINENAEGGVPGTPVEMSATYSNIAGGYGIPADNNINTNPNFTGSFPWAFRINGIPCVDAGSSTILESIRGVPRPQGAHPDMGAYEYSATGPTALCDAFTVELDTNCAASLTAADIDGGSSAAAGIWKIEASQTTFDSGDIPSRTVVLTVTDILNRQDTCSASVTVNDVIAPVITSCPDSQLLNLDANCQVAIPDLAALVEADDNCGIAAITQDPPAGTLVSVDTEVTMTVTDVGGNSVQCTAWVNVQDVTDPVITSCPGDQLLDLDANCQVAIPDLAGSVVADDNCGIAAITQDPPAGTLVAADTEVTMTVTDVGGNSVQCTAWVNVQDVTDPVITSCPGDQLLDLDANCQVAIPDLAALVVADDNCDVAEIVQDPPAGTLVSVDTEVTITVTDVNDNTAQCSAWINVQDVTPPVITRIGPSPLTHQLGDPYTDAGAEAEDNCDGPLTVTVGGDSVDVNVVDDYTITYNVSDAAGNPADEVTRLVRVRDVANPFLTDVTVDDGHSVLVTFNKTMGAGVLDASNYSISGSGMGTLDENPESVTLESGNTYRLSWPACSPGVSQEMLHGGDITITVALVVEDASGNPMDDEGGNEMTHEDGAIGEAPVISACAEDVELEADANCQVTAPDLTDDVIATDNCTATENLSVTQEPPAGTILDVDTVVTLIVADEAGNVTTCDVNITIVDATPPDIISCPTNVNALVDANCEAQVPDLRGDVVATDNCTEASALLVTQDPPSGTTITDDTMVTITVADEVGNTAHCDVNVTVVDNIAPVVTINGPNPLIVECAEPISLPGASALDNCDGTRPVGVTTPPGLSMSNPRPGAYNVVYSATDLSGNTGTATLLVEVENTSIPVVTIFGPDTIEIECGVSFTTFPAASATDECDGTLPVSPTNLGGLSTANPQIGSYTVTYTATDGNGNTGSEVLQVDVVDTTPPVITRLGAEFVFVDLGTSYTDAGAMATDMCDGILTGEIDTDNPVNVNEAGLYEVTYNVTDSEGLAAEQVSRFVYVGDMSDPHLIDLQVASQLEIWVTFNKPMREEDDPTGVLRAANFTVSGSGIGTFNTHPDSVTPYGSLNRYVLTWSRPDEMRNGGDIVITVDEAVQDAEGNPIVFNIGEHSGGALGQAPVITLNGADETLECGVDSFVEAGATAVDNVDGTVAVVIDGDDLVDTTVPGDYVISYTAEDAAGNPALATRTITVQDTAPPLITRIGAAEATVECGAVYTDAGATATDACDGDLTTHIITDNPVDTDVVGVYSVTYNVEDSTGNAAEQITRTVTVVDTQSPIITLLGDNPYIIADGADYTEGGAEAWDACDGDLTYLIDIENNVPNTDALGVYPVVYTVSDSADNTATTSRTVIVKPVDCVMVLDLEVAPNPVAPEEPVTFKVIELPGSCSVGALDYIWLKAPLAEKSGFQVIPHAPNASQYTIDSASHDDAGVYMCTVSDSGDPYNSPQVTLLVSTGVPAFGALALMLAAATTALAGIATMRKRQSN